MRHEPLTAAMDGYHAPWWLPGGNAQTLWAALYAQRHFGPAPVWQRTRWDTPDGDFIDVDLSTHTVPPGAPLLVLFHGLEGSSASQYAVAFADFAASEGLAFAVPHFRGCSGEINRALLRALPHHPELAAVEADMLHLLSSWFNPGFLEMQQVDWASPARLLEKIIHHEAVHAIDGWDDLRRRLQPDRRCFAFFHPALPGEPLIFVEVALVDRISDSITPLLDETAALCDITKATTAIFYSISNTQTGLRGVSFGDSLIKHVVETLQQEFPRLRTFATLSPIPGLRAWLGKHAGAMLERLDERRRAELGRAVGFEPPQVSHLLAAFDKAQGLDERSPVRQMLLQCAAHYLARELVDGKPVDPVARFHLGNGARVERLNWAGDPSAKGHKQSYGLMVNYLYDLKRIDRHRSQLAQGQVAVSRDIEGLLAAR